MNGSMLYLVEKSQGKDSTDLKLTIDNLIINIHINIINLN